MRICPVCPVMEIIVPVDVTDVEQEAAQALWEAPLEELAAAQAFYQLLLTEEAVTPASITAGDLRLAGGSRSEKAAQLVAEKRRAASPALVETDFAFCNIRKGEEDGSAQ